MALLYDENVQWSHSAWDYLSLAWNLRLTHCRGFVESRVIYAWESNNAHQYVRIKSTELLIHGLKTAILKDLDLFLLRYLRTGVGSQRVEDLGLEL